MAYENYFFLGLIEPISSYRNGVQAVWNIRTTPPDGMHLLLLFLAS